jgi:hypothetical protein
MLASTIAVWRQNIMTYEAAMNEAKRRARVMDRNYTVCYSEKERLYMVLTEARYNEIKARYNHIILVEVLP